MTDIVERLLLKKTLETVEDVHVLFADAADEIDRLRDALRRIEAASILPDEVADLGLKQINIIARAALGEKE